ncbi:MAG TPA: hypothetical protein DCY20_03405 [Firmicutes bacterium]|nr:hypothetical protein [Bacillota bacterium]
MQEKSLLVEVRRMKSSTSMRVSVPIKPIRIPVKEDHGIEVKTRSGQDVVSEAKIRSQLLIKEAMEQKNQLIESARLEAEQLKKQAYNEAYEQGYKKGAQDGHEEGFKQVVLESTAHLDSLKQEYFKAQAQISTYLDTMNPQLLDLMKNIVEKMTLQELEGAENKIMPLLSEALKEISQRKQIFIKTHANVYDVVKTHESEIQEMCVYGNIRILKDLSLEPFGCVIETESEMINLQLSKQLDNLFQELEAVVI